MLALDGKTVIDDPNVYGQEWQVLGREPTLFQTVRFPQHPQVMYAPCPQSDERVASLSLGVDSR
jgi:hypothetical protein